MSTVFKVWASDRSRKISFIAPCSVPNVIARGSHKLNIPGNRLVLESDGTEIEENDVLQRFSTQALIILEANEVWKENISLSRNSSLEGNDLSVKSDTDMSIDSKADDIATENNIINIPANQEIAEIPPVADNEQNTQFVCEENVTDVNLNVWLNYTYNWANLEPSYLKQLQSGTSRKGLKKEVVHKVILQMRQISRSIHSAVLSRVASSMVQKCPDSFEDRKNGKKYGSGYAVLYETLKNQNNYLERILKTEDKCSQRKKTPASKAPFLIQAKLGAVNWQPGEHREGENDITVEEKRVSLLNLYHHVLQIGEATPAAVHEEILDSLTGSFKCIREFLNDVHDMPTPESVYLSWPVIFRREYLCHLYSLQMGHSVQFLKDNFHSDRQAIFAFGRAYNLTTGHKSDNDYDVVHIILKYFGEKIENLTTECPVSLNFKTLFLHWKT